MKKIFPFIILIFCIFFIPSVFAEEATLSLVESKGTLYYDERYIKEEDFTKKIDTTSLEVSTSSFSLWNGTEQKQELFLLMESKGQDGSFDDLLDYLTLKVMVDEEVVYEGSASVLNYATKDNDLQDFIPLGTFPKDFSGELSIEMTVSPEYLNSSKNMFSYVHFSFYTYDKEKELVELGVFTREMFYNSLDIWVFCGICILVAILFLTIYLIRTKNKYKIEAKKEEKRRLKEEKKEK